MDPAGGSPDRGSAPAGSVSVGPATAGWPSAGQTHTGPGSGWSPSAGAPYGSGAAPVGGNPPSGPGAYPAAVGPAAGARSWSWRLRESAWVVAALPFGLTTWAGFLYIGLRARRTSWLWTTGAYWAGAALLIGLAAITPADADGQTDMDAWQSRAGMTVMGILWVGGVVHALLVNRQWLRWRAQSG